MEQNELADGEHEAQGDEHSDTRQHLAAVSLSQNCAAENQHEAQVIEERGLTNKAKE